MKKKLVGLVLGAMGLMLVACSSQEAPQEAPQETTQETLQEAAQDVSQDNEQEVSQDTDVESDEVVVNEDAENVDIDDDDEEIFEGADTTNPWVDSDKAGVLEATGFDLVAPAEAVNVIYSYMPSTGMAQMNYNLDNAMWVYRVQPSEELQDISGMYYEWNYIDDVKIAGMDGVEYGYASEQEGDFIDDMDYVRVVNWYDEQNKVTYSLAVLGTDLNGMDTVVYAEDLFLNQ